MAEIRDFEAEMETLKQAFDAHYRVVPLDRAVGLSLDAFEALISAGVPLKTIHDRLAVTKTNGDPLSLAHLRVSLSKARTRRRIEKLEARASGTAAPTPAPPAPPVAAVSVDPPVTEKPASSSAQPDPMPDEAIEADRQRARSVLSKPEKDASAKDALAAVKDKYRVQ